MCFDRAAPFYDQTRALPDHVRAAVARLATDLLDKRSRLIEIGIGTGRIARLLHEHGARITGVDLSWAMMARLRESGADIALAQADAHHLPFADQRFEAAILVHVLHLVGDWQQVLSEVRRVLRPDGRMLIGSTQPVNASAAEQLRDQFLALVSARHPLPQARSRRFVEQMVLPYLRASGAQIETRHTPPWRTQRTLRQELQQLRDRVFSLTWRLPDALVDEVLDQLAREHAAALDQPRETEQHFTWYCVTWN